MAIDRIIIYTCKHDPERKISMKRTKKCHIRSNDEYPGVSKLKILIKLCSSNVITRRNVVIPSMVKVFVKQEGNIQDPAFGFCVPRMRDVFNYT